MDIGYYIGDLLSEQDEVSVAGLGTINKIRIAGSFDRSNNLFLPPTYQLSFKEIETNDSSLAQHISIEKNLSISSSEELIRKFSADIFESLNNSDSVEIRHLGILQKNNGKLTLIPGDDFGISDKFFGLSPIGDLKKEAFIPLQEENQIAEPEMIEQEEEAEIIHKTRSWITIFVSFLAILISFSVLFYFNTDFNNFVKNKSFGLFSSHRTTKQVIPEVIESEKISSDSIKNAVDSASILADSVRQKSDTTITVPALTESLAITAQAEIFNYEIIVAAFSRKSEADEYILKLNSRGIKAKIVENMRGKMLKISLFTFEDEELAKKELIRIQKNINKDAWIARVKQFKNPK
jgi:hypothetical protein